MGCLHWILQLQTLPLSPNRCTCLRIHLLRLMWSVPFFRLFSHRALYTFSFHLHTFLFGVVFVFRFCHCDLRFLFRCGYVDLLFFFVVFPFLVSFLFEQVCIWSSIHPIPSSLVFCCNSVSKLPMTCFETRPSCCGGTHQSLFKCEDCEHYFGWLFLHFLHIFLLSVSFLLDCFCIWCCIAWSS